MTDAKLSDEDGRLAALRALEVLDTEPEAPFEQIMALVKSVLGVPITAVSLIDADRQWLKSRQGLERRETPRDVSFCTHTIKSRAPLIIPDATNDPMFRANPLVVGPPHIVSYAGVPLETADGYNIGALCAIDTVPRQFDAAQIEILKSFASLVMGELQLRRIADRDYMTGALCRRAFVGEMDRAIARFQRHGRQAALAMLDIDHFKSINDRYGHAAGDAALRAVSARIAGVLRPDDTLGRLGGEEFGILLSETDFDGAMTAAERFRAALAAMIVPNEPPLRLTASFGVAMLGDGIATSDAWMAAADGALYAAKRAGRNRCRAAGDDDGLTVAA